MEQLCIISSIHSAEHACRNSTSMCSIHDFPYNKHNKKSLLQAAATIRERLMCRHAVAKVQLLFGIGFHSRAAFVQDFTVYMDLRANPVRSKVRQSILMCQGVKIN